MLYCNSSDVKAVEQADPDKDEKLTTTIRPSPFYNTSNIKPYIIMSCDTPMLLLSHIKLKADNYEQWATFILIGIRGKRKKSFIGRSMKQLSRDSRD